MVDVHRMSILAAGVKGDSTVYDSLVDAESYPFGVFHHKSSLLVSYTNKENFPRLDVRLIYLKDEEAYRTRCGFSVKLRDVPALVEMLLAMMKVSDSSIQYPVRYFEKNPLVKDIPKEAIQHFLCKKRSRKPSTDTPNKKKKVHDNSEKPWKNSTASASSRRSGKERQKSNVETVPDTESETDTILLTDNENE